MYAGAVRVLSHLVEVHQTRGPAGYSGFRAAHHGVIIAGYSNGIRPGPRTQDARRHPLDGHALANQFARDELPLYPECR